MPWIFWHLWFLVDWMNAHTLTFIIYVMRIFRILRLESFSILQWLIWNVINLRKWWGINENIWIWRCLLSITVMEANFSRYIYLFFYFFNARGWTFFDWYGIESLLAIKTLRSRIGMLLIILEGICWSIKYDLIRISKDLHFSIFSDK